MSSSSSSSSSSGGRAAAVTYKCTPRSALVGIVDDDGGVSVLRSSISNPDVPACQELRVIGVAHVSINSSAECDLERTLMTVLRPPHPIRDESY